MTKLWLIGYDAPCSLGSYEPIVVLQCDHEPTKREAESAVHSAFYTGGSIYIESITETSESEMRGKEYYLAGAKQ